MSSNTKHVNLIGGTTCHVRLYTKGHCTPYSLFFVENWNKCQKTWNKEERNRQMQCLVSIKLAKFKYKTLTANKAFSIKTSDF